MGPVRQMLRQVRLVINQRGCLCIDRKSPIGAGWFFGVLHAFESTAPEKLTTIQRVIRAVAAPLHRRLASAASQLLACRSRVCSAKLAGLRPVFGQLAPARITHLESSVFPN